MTPTLLPAAILALVAALSGAILLRALARVLRELAGPETSAIAPRDRD